MINIKKVINTLAGEFGRGKIENVVKTIKFITNDKKQQDRLKNLLLSDISKRKSLKEKYDKLKKEVGRLVLRKESGGRITTFQEKKLNLFAQIAIPDKEALEIRFDSSWLLWAKYIPQSKTLFIAMKSGKIIYPFFRVPKTKVLLLEEINGKFMWDYFGKHYSANPKHWIRRR